MTTPLAARYTELADALRLCGMDLMPSGRGEYAIDEDCGVRVVREGRREYLRLRAPLDESIAGIRSPSGVRVESWGPEVYIDVKLKRAEPIAPDHIERGLRALLELQDRMLRGLRSGGENPEPTPRLRLIRGGAA